MPIFSKIPSPSDFSTDDDGAGHPDDWSPSPLSNNRSFLAGCDPRLSHSGPGNSSRHLDSRPRLSYPTDLPGHLHQTDHRSRSRASEDRRSHSRASEDLPSYSRASEDHHSHSRASEDRRSYSQASEDRRSRSHITISSDDTTASNIELTEVRKENTMLKVECGRLRGENTTLKDAYYKLLETINKNVELAREEVKGLADRILTRTADPIDPPAGSSAISSKPLKENYVGLKWWDQALWLAVKSNNQQMNLGIDCPIISLYMEDEFGEPIPPGVKAALRKDLYAYWNDLFYAGSNDLRKYGDLGLDRKNHFRKTFEDKYPWLRLCEAHWKVDQLWISYFSTWKRPRKSPAAKAEGSSPVSTSATQGTSPILGSKRRLEEYEHLAEDPSKRHKGKEKDVLMAPTDFHHARPVPRQRKKTTPATAKGLLTKSRVTASVQETPIVQDVPVASGSGMVRLSPPPSSVPQKSCNDAQDPPTTSTIHPSAPPPISGHAASPAHLSAPPPISGQVVVSLTQQSRDCRDTLNKVVLAPAEVVPDSQPPTLPEFYTSPIPVPPDFTPIGPAVGEGGTSTTPNHPEPSAAPKKKISFVELICEAWVKAGNGDEKAFRSYWKHLPKAEKDAQKAAKKAETAAARLRG